MKHPMKRLLSCGLLTTLLVTSTSQTLTVSAESNSINEQNMKVATEGDATKTEEKTTKVKKSVKKVFKKKGYTNAQVHIRKRPTSKSKSLKILKLNTKVKYNNYNSKWVEIKYKKSTAYIYKKYISKKKTKKLKVYTWNGPKLTKSKGVNYGPSGKETYYNLNMSGVVRIMKNQGYNYKYWIRKDGCKMYGDYIMVAANLKLRPRGSLVKTSLGMGIVCDTGGFAKSNPTALDIATNW